MEGVYQAGIVKKNMFHIICQIIWYLEVSLILYYVKVMKCFDKLVCSKNDFNFLVFCSNNILIYLVCMCLPMHGMIGYVTECGV